MAKAKYISDFELDVIRIGVSQGHQGVAIAKYLGRSKQSVYGKIAEMKAAGTLENMPFDFVTSTIAVDLNGKG